MQHKRCSLWPRFHIHIDVIKSLNFRTKRPSTTGANEHDMFGKNHWNWSGDDQINAKNSNSHSFMYEIPFYEIVRHNPELTAKLELFEDLDQGKL